MTQPAESYLTFEAFLEAEEASVEKHEWLDGVVYDMTDASIEHARIQANILVALKEALLHCDVFSSDVRIFVEASNLCTYPDAAVVCGGTTIKRVERNGRAIGEALLNPTILVEVLSPSTEKYDRGEKFSHYMRIASLEAYVLVAQDERRIEVFRRPKRGHWERDEATSGTIEIHGAAIRVEDVYRRAGG